MLFRSEGLLGRCGLVRDMDCVYVCADYETYSAERSTAALRMHVGRMMLLVRECAAVFVVQIILFLAGVDMWRAE